MPFNQGNGHKYPCEWARGRETRNFKGSSNLRPVDVFDWPLGALNQFNPYLEKVHWLSQFETHVKPSTPKTARLRLPIVVHTLLIDAEQRILLLERENTGFLDGFFTLPGGHLQVKEHVVECAKRECLEETTIEVIELSPSSVMPFMGGIDFLFRVVKWNGEAKIGEPDRCSRIGWFPVVSLPQNVAPFVNKALELDASDDWFHQFEG